MPDLMGGGRDRGKPAAEWGRLVMYAAQAVWATPWLNGRNISLGHMH